MLGELDTVFCVVGVDCHLNVVVMVLVILTLEGMRHIGRTEVDNTVKQTGKPKRKFKTSH